MAVVEMERCDCDFEPADVTSTMCEELRYERREELEAEQAMDELDIWREANEADRRLLGSDDEL